jgi:pseudouridine synthase
MLAWHKPWGVTTTHADPHAEITLPQALTPLLGETRAARMLSIGRLDRESEGLLLLTPERRLVSPIAHPRAGLQRGYAVMCDLPLGHAEQTRLRAGIRLTDGWARALDAREIRPDDRLPEDVLDDGSDPAQWSYIALGEGRHHEVRRLYGAIARPVRRLIRISFGPVHLANIRVGEARNLKWRDLREIPPPKGSNQPPDIVLYVTGKTGPREVVARTSDVKEYFKRLLELRTDELEKIAVGVGKKSRAISMDDYVFCNRDGTTISSFKK